VRPPQEVLPEAPGGVQHARGQVASPAPSPRTIDAFWCARCGDPLAVAGSGRLRPGTRYCSARCRFAAVRDRRASARADLLQALAQLGDAAAGIETALKSLGLRPSKPRTKKKEKS